MDSEFGSGMINPDGFSFSIPATDFQTNTDTWRNSIGSRLGFLDTPSLQEISVRYEASAPPPAVTNVEPISTPLPLDTSSAVAALQDISVGFDSPPTVSNAEPIYSKRPRGRPRRSVLSSSSPHPRPRGRPHGSGRKRKLIVDESAITNLGELVTHIIYVGAGEDIKKEVKEFARGKQSIVVLSGLGTLSYVNIENPNYGFSERQEGSLPILSLNGEYTQNCGTGEPVGHLKVTISCPDGSVRGGEVGKTMLAESQVQVIVAITQVPIPGAAPDSGNRPTTYMDDVYIPERLPSFES